MRSSLLGHPLGELIPSYPPQNQRFSPKNTMKVQFLTPFPHHLTSFTPSNFQYKTPKQQTKDNPPSSLCIHHLTVACIHILHNETNTESNTVAGESMLSYTYSSQVLFIVRSRKKKQLNYIQRSTSTLFIFFYNETKMPCSAPLA